MIRRAAGAVWLALAAAACGRPIFVPPSGPGVATNASTAWTAVTANCRSAQSYSGALRVSGKAGSGGFRGLAIESGVTRDQIYLNATYSGQPIFLLAGSSSDATLWLRRENRVVKGPAGQIIEGILGLRVPPDRLLALLTGCVTRSFDVTSAVSYGQQLAVQTPDARLYLEQQQGWKIIAGEAEGFIVEVSWKAGALPVKLWLNSQPGREPHASLNISIDESNLNPSIPASFFTPPAGATSADPMTLEELRSGSWRKTS